jgi:hypothetical protein
VSNDVRGHISEGALPDPIDLTEFFRGGEPPIKYSIDPKDHADWIFKLTLDADAGTVAVALRSATDNDPGAADEYTGVDNGDGTPTTVTATATDADGHESMGKTIYVLRNKPPTENTGQAEEAVVVGTLAADDKRAVGDRGGIVNCPKRFNECEATITDEDFVDDEVFGFTNAQGSPENRELLTYSIAKSHSAVAAAIDGSTIKLMGLTSTWNADKTPAAGFDDAIVTVRATDKGGLYVDRDYIVHVDEPPRIKKQIGAQSVKKGADMEVVNDVDSFFSDPENGTTALTYAVSSSDTTVAEISDANANLSSDGHLIVAAKNPGTSTITVKATDQRGQTTEQTFTLTVAR